MVSVWCSIIYVYLDNTMTTSTIQIILLITFVNLRGPDDYDYYHGDHFYHAALFNVWAHVRIVVGYHGAIVGWWNGSSSTK